MFRLSFQGAGPGGDTGTINIVTAATPHLPLYTTLPNCIVRSVGSKDRNVDDKFKVEFY